MPLPPLDFIRMNRFLTFNSLRLTLVLILSALLADTASSTVASNTLPSEVETTAAADIAPSLMPVPIVHTVTFGPKIVFVAPPPAGWNLTPILHGSKVRLALDESFAGATTVSWFRNGVKIAAATDSPTLDLINFRSWNDGLYEATFQFQGEQHTTQGWEIKAVSFTHAPLTNLSSRSTISPIGPQSVAGFVISEQGVAAEQTRLVLIRAVGPSLADKGVAHPLADPRLNVFSAAGELVDPIPHWDPALPGSNNENSFPTYEEYLTAVMASVGAFPVPLSPAIEPVLVYELEAGVYTVVVDSLSNGTGDILTEIYETTLWPADLINVP